MAPAPGPDSLPPLTAFEERFLSKLQKVDSQEIERFLTEVVRERQFLQVVFDAMTDGVVVLKQNLEVQYLNSPAIELLGLNARNRILGQRLPGLVPIEELRGLLARYALAPCRTDSFEVAVRHRPERMILSVSLLPLEPGSSGGGTILMVRDVTAVRQADLEKQRAQQAATMATLSAGLAHEIKNPLNSLLLHAQLLRQSIAELPVARRRGSGPDRERMSSSAAVIVDEIVRLNSKVNEFLAAVRPGRPQFESVRLPQLLERIGDTLRPEADSAAVRLITMADHELPAIQADPSQLIQVIQNLVKNSLEAITQGPGREGSDGPMPQIEIRAELAGDAVALSVRDNGPGISPQSLPRILEPYFTSKEMGTGLGLNIVSRIVEEHGGRLNVITRPVVEGTVISVILPLSHRFVRKLNEPGETGAG